MCPQSQKRPWIVRESTESAAGFVHGSNGYGKYGDEWVSPFIPLVLLLVFPPKRTEESIGDGTDHPDSDLAWMAQQATANGDTGLWLGGCWLCHDPVRFGKSLAVLTAI
ncbi:hypothetical protein PABG_06999 [Paracoccidioides brasiliensis Pb03]|nr:hypothetical protein PABG_06999 [Paracoccidioides brasiliensis Pb03]